jgi:hypothetical protein
MPRYEVVWEELRYVTYVAEVEAKSEWDAIKKAQDCEAYVKEIIGDCYSTFDASVREIEE